MRITCKETITRFHTITVDDVDITDPDDLETDAIREQMWKETADNGWNYEYVTECTFSEGEHEPTYFFHG
jgi:hypothetical protein